MCTKGSSDIISQSQQRQVKSSSLKNLCKNLITHEVSSRGEYASLLCRSQAIIRGGSVFPLKIMKESRDLDSTRLLSHRNVLFLCQNNIYNHLKNIADRVRHGENIQGSPLTAGSPLVDMIDGRWVQMCWVHRASPWTMSLWGHVMTVRSSGSSPSDPWAE